MDRISRAMFIATILISGATASAERFYVNAAVTSGAGDGSSWDNAFVGVQGAISVAQQGDEVWVATGTCLGMGGGA